MDECFSWLWNAVCLLSKSWVSLTRTFWVVINKVTRFVHELFLFFNVKCWLHHCRLPIYWASVMFSLFCIDTGSFSCIDGSSTKNHILNANTTIDAFRWSLLKIGSHCHAWNIRKNWIQGWWGSREWGQSLSFSFSLVYLLNRGKLYKRTNKTNIDILLLIHHLVFICF